MDSSTHTVWIWTVMLMVYLCTLLNKGHGPGMNASATWHIIDSAKFQVLGTYTLLAITCVMAVANWLRSVPLVSFTWG